uniref:Uncharacterized protein n=1 Tax=Ciona intestinalis TaxID=7719 RepID=H2XMF2_CIOIN
MEKFKRYICSQKERSRQAKWIWLYSHTSLAILYFNEVFGQLHQAPQVELITCSRQSRTSHN